MRAGSVEVTISAPITVGPDLLAVTVGTTLGVFAQTAYAAAFRLTGAGGEHLVEGHDAGPSVGGPDRCGGHRWS